MPQPNSTKAPKIPWKPRPPGAVVFHGLAFLGVTCLTGCLDQDPNAFAPACAPVGILAEAADFSDYGAVGTPDLSRLVAQGSIVGVTGHCSNAAGGTQLHTVLRVQLAMTRGPVMQGSSLSVPYFVAITQNGSVISKIQLTAQVQFPANGDRVALNTDPAAFDLPVTRLRPGISYRIEVGFQLSPAELDYNRAHIPR